MRADPARQSGLKGLISFILQFYSLRHVTGFPRHITFIVYQKYFKLKAFTSNFY